ncbi:MAG: cytochrome d ubiquinol oxidase subunit II [Hyphomicrobiaceae bacterium]|nr:cytochrome d ubiquinol oxidase subunit II [Hyphomicrobiaceae bacterium]
MTLDLPLIWAGLIAFAVFAYVVLDGFDLGVGMLFPLIDGTSNRDTAMNSVAPVWDGNETWLVLGGGGLFAVFPLAYAVIMPALYAPVTAMLLGLVLRGVAFEFRWRTERGKVIWDWAFALGSLTAAIAQGFMLGALVQGIKVDGRAYGGGWFDWLTPFSMTTAAAVTVGYALLGATWLILKTEGDVQRRAFGLAPVLTVALLVGIGAVSLWTPFLSAHYAERWFSYPAILFAAPVPILALLAAGRLMLSINDRRDVEPFLATLALFALCFIGLGISLYPYIVPLSITIADAAGPDKSLAFLLAGASVLIPLILMYTAYSYWVFRGKVDTKGGYH